MNRILALPVLICLFFLTTTAQSAPIHDAVVKGDIAKVTSLLKASQSIINTCDKTGATPLHYAAASGRADLMKLLIGKGANVNVKKPDGVTPMHIAASTGRLEPVELLINSKADVNAVDLAGRTPLSIAMEKGHKEIVQSLLECGATAGKPVSVGQPIKSLVYPKSPPPSKVMLHVDMKDLSWSAKVAMSTLQGLVNREQPRIYITHVADWGGYSLTPKWMEGMTKNGYSFVNVPDPLSLFAVFARNVKGAVIYESDIETHPERLHKINVLTLYCSLNDTIPLTKEMNARLKLPVLLDVSERLNSGEEAYSWAYKELWPRANHKLLAFTSPYRVLLSDYLIVNRVMPIWISEDMDANAEQICMRFVDEINLNSPVMGCWGVYPEQKPTGRIGESTLQQMISVRGKFMVVAEACFNLSVHSGLVFDTPQKPKPNRYVPLNPQSVYICFNFTDGDNIQYIQHLLGNNSWWADVNRGRIPLAWSVNPSVADLMPDVLEYFINTSTPNDELICSGNGVGIAASSLYGKNCANRNAVYNDYIQTSGKAIKQAGFTSIHLGDTSAIMWTKLDFDDWAKALPDLDGILGDYSPMPGIDGSNAAFLTSDGMPVVRALANPGVPMNAQALANSIRLSTPIHRPAFMHVALIPWHNTPSIVAEAVGMLGPEYVPVTPSNFFTLMKTPVETRIRYEFMDGAEGWGIANDIGDMEVKDGIITGTATGEDPYLIRGNMRVNAEDVSKVVVKVKAGVGGGGVKFYFVTDSSPVWDEAKSARTENVGADGNWHEYTLPIGQNPNWKGIITGIRINPTCLKANIPFSVDYIRGE